jgi:hypothetical protein
VRIFFKLLLAIPHLIVIYLLFIPLSLLTLMAWFAILFTGRYPKSFFEFTSGVLRWGANVAAYCALLRDEYPPFSWEPGDYPLTLDIPRAPRQSRFRLFIRVFSIWPNYLALYFVQIAWFFTTFVSWFAILITGHYPRGLFHFSVGVMRWWQRQASYLYLLRDEYPPYSINANARPGNEALSVVLGVPILVLYVAVNLLPFAGLLGNEHTTVTVQSSITSPRLASERPAGTANSVRITILDYDDDAFPTGTTRTLRSGYHYVAFTIQGEKDGRWPAFFSPFFLRLHDCFDNGYSPVDAESIEGTFVFGLWWFSGDTTGDVYFEVPRGFVPCNLVYHSGRGEVEFVFD